MTNSNGHDCKCDETGVTNPDQPTRLGAAIGHDLRTPLQTAIARLELARMECESEHLAEIQTALDRIESLIGDLERLSCLRQPIRDLDRIELSTVVDSCWNTIQTGEVTLEIQTDATVLADRSRLRQLLENLLANAITHGGDTVRVGDLEDEAGFYVADDGPGIEPELRERVCEPGVSTEGGQGFGLYVVVETATAHGWTVSISTSREGGARFDIDGVDIVT